MNLTAWKRELHNDYDKEFLLNGIKSRFNIIDPKASPTSVELSNHPSARASNPLYKKATDQILEELREGNYVHAPSPPVIVSPLGVIPKPDGGVRLIHDCSRPAGLAVNDYVSNFHKQKFQTLDDAKKLVRQGSYFAKVDLKSAYRSVPISPYSQQVTGLKWEINHQLCYLYDTKLPFGSKLAPGIFHRLSQAVRRMMSRRGYTIVVYLDDFLICEHSKDKCHKALVTLIYLLRELGFYINWHKVVDPIQRITFLGIEICSISMSLRLPEDKLLSLREELASFLHRKRASKHQLQSLAGKLNWAAAVVYGGRVFLRRIINAFCMLKHKTHKLRLNADIIQDIQWWHNFISTFNGKSLLLHMQPLTSVFTDACEAGGGGVYNSDWFYCNWELDLPQATSFHINEKEILAVVIAAHRWAYSWANHTVYVFSDNSTTVACINKGSSRNALLMHYIRQLFWLSAIYNFRLIVKHISSKNNVLADVVSRLHDRDTFVKFFQYHLHNAGKFQLISKSHVSGLTSISLYSRHVLCGQFG